MLLKIGQSHRWFPKSFREESKTVAPAAKEFVVQNLERSRMDELDVDELGVSRVRICLLINLT